LIAKIPQTALFRATDAQTARQTLLEVISEQIKAKKNLKKKIFWEGTTRGAPALKSKAKKLKADLQLPE
jgi:hypothetical protein